MLRLALRLILALVLATTSVTSVVAHGQMQGAVDLVICSDGAHGSGVAVVTLDATGKPVARAKCCTDCLAAQAMALLPAPVTAPLPLRQSSRLARPAQLSGESLTQPLGSARGPPALA